MDFYEIVKGRPPVTRPREFSVLPNFLYLNQDLVCKGNVFFAYWNGRIWSTDFNSMVRIIDKDLYEKTSEFKQKEPDAIFDAKPLNKHNTKSMTSMLTFLKQVEQSNAIFNNKILFATDTPKREDYATHILDYTPTKGDTPSFDELFGVLYEEQELNKILWFMGALLVGDMSKIQKFLFLYGGKGTGKGTILKVIKKVFDGYVDSINLKDLTGTSEFATSEVKEIPLLIDEDCDLSSIANDTYLLKLTAHEPIKINAKYKQAYLTSFNGLLIAASNERFKVKHVDSGITRRAVVAEPTNHIVDSASYHKLMKAIDFEIPAIAQKAIDTYTDLGLGYFDNYVDIATLEATDHIFAFVDEYRDSLGDPTTLKSAAALYKEYLEDIQFETTGYKRRIKQALMKYYTHFDKEKKVGADKLRNVYTGFKDYLFTSQLGSGAVKEEPGWIKFDGKDSIFDVMYNDSDAQLASIHGTPMVKWELCKTRLRDIDTSELHWVKVEPNHIVIDFDLREDGEKSLKLSLEAANLFPPTYAETSKSGQGLHLHYLYDGDIDRLSSLYDHNIEVKVFRGNSSLRRKLSLCNTEQIAKISTGLPLKEENKKMYDSLEKIVWTERKLRTAIERNIRKEYHPNTRPSVDFIEKLLNDAQEANLEYDVSDLYQDLLNFSMSSTNQAEYCMTKVIGFQLCTIPEEAVYEKTSIIPNEKLWMYDVECWPNLFMVVCKKYGTTEKKTYFNPTKFEVEEILKLPLVVFNGLRYDNHMMYGAMMGENNEQLYQRSQRIIKNEKGAMHSGAYNASYIDVYEMATKKQSLKKWQAELGIHHDEMDWPWDKPLPEELWPRAEEYCWNDNVSLEVVFDHLKADYDARCIIAEVSGLPVNSKTQQHAAQIIFEGNKNARDQFVYTDLGEELFEGYEYSYGKSTYMGENPSEGGYVYAEPGVYKNVVLLDIISMHPRSAILLNIFGKYTKNFEDIVDSRVAVKEHRFDDAASMFNGALVPYLHEDSADDLAYALKIIINIVYGMTSAKWPNAFKSDDNVDNIVAKRGALFMVALKHKMFEMGAQVVHIKTDSIKLVDPTPEQIQAVHDFGNQYGYKFDHEATYSRMALVNDAVYIAQYGWHGTKPKKINTWDAVGAMFAEPYVYKKLFSKEEFVDSDYYIIKSVTGATAMYLEDADPDSPDQFIGKTSTVYASVTGFNLIRIDPEKDKRGAVTGSKGFKWRVASDFKGVKDIDINYYDGQVSKAIKAINKVGPTYMIIDDVPTEFQDEVVPF